MKQPFPGNKKNSLHVEKFLLNGTSCQWRDLSIDRRTFFSDVLGGIQVSD